MYIQLHTKVQINIFYVQEKLTSWVY